MLSADLERDKTHLWILEAIGKEMPSSTLNKGKGEKNVSSLMYTSQIASVFSVLKKNTVQHRPVVWLSRHLLRLYAVWLLSVVKRIVVLVVQLFFKGETEQADSVTGWLTEIVAGTFPSRKDKHSWKRWEIFTNNRFSPIFSPLFWNDKEWYINHPNVRRELSQYRMSPYNPDKSVTCVSRQVLTEYFPSCSLFTFHVSVPIVVG